MFSGLHVDTIKQLKRIPFSFDYINENCGTLLREGICNKEQCKECIYDNIKFSLQRQIPKPVKYKRKDSTDDRYFLGVCPCGRWLNSSYVFCDSCGQLLDWGDNE